MLLIGCWFFRVHVLALTSFTKEMPETIQKDLLRILPLRMDKMEQVPNKVCGGSSNIILRMAQALKAVDYDKSASRAGTISLV